MSVNNSPRCPPGFPADKWAYFEGEARIASDPADPRYLNPDFSEGARVLCVGCGGGWAGESVGAGLYVGVDVDDDARRYRLAWARSTPFCVASGENLPFQDGAFDYYVARVSVMYMDIPRCLSEAYRVLSPGGRIWFTCHDFRHAWNHLRRNIRAMQPKAAVYRSYVIGNGLLFHAIGRLVHFPLNRARIESFQTRKAILRAARWAGFDEVRFPVTRGGEFLVTAQKSA